ncbi:MAG: hypothetical protein ABIL58_13325 [Pseudomonadota bacterium]
MNRLTLIGIITLVASGVTLIFQAVSSMMTVGEIVMEHVSLESFFGVDTFYWIDDLPWGFLQQSADYIIQVPIFLGLAAIGVILLIIGGFVSR